MQKKKWTKPKLIVLVRDQPGERVLQNCKVNFLGGGPSAEAIDCRVEFCAECSGLGTS